MAKVIFLITITCLLLSVMICEVRFAFTIFRDAAKSPDLLDPTNKDLAQEVWTNKGDLTGSGMRMHYLLGYNNINRWSTFLSASYNSNELYVKSTPNKSAVSSVISNLQGLYSPSTGPILTANQQTKAVPPVSSSLFSSEKISLATNALPNLEQVIPIDIFTPNDKYYFFNYNFNSCPALLDLVKTNAQLTTNVNAVQNFNVSWGSLLQSAIHYPTSEWLLDFENIDRVCDEFLSDYVDDRTLSTYTNAGINLNLLYDEVQNFKFQSNFYYYNGDANYSFAKVSTSSIFQDIENWMQSRITNDRKGISYDNSDPKLVVYSTNDLILGSMQTVLAAAFNIGGYFATPYASSFIFELGVPDNSNLSLLTNNDYTVTITYNEVTYLAATPFPQFTAALQAYILTTQQIDQFCGWRTPAAGNSANAYIDATIALSCALFVALIAILILLIRNSKRSGSVIEFNNEKPLAAV